MPKLNLSGLLTTLVVLVATPTLAGEQDIAELDAKVNARVQQLEDAGFLPTYEEIEMIRIDIVDQEVQSTGISAAVAVDKYQLTPLAARLVKIKEAVREQSLNSGGEIVIPPPPPPDED